MRSLRKKRSIEERFESPRNNNNRQSNLDVWLSRLSHISQFGLFALTIGALYFTVIPLYKTAALEESIARRESELSATNAKLETAAAALAKVKQEIYERNRSDLVKGIIYVAPYCSGLMMALDAVDSKGDGELGANLLKVDAAQCLRDEFHESKAEKVLATSDYSYLKDVIETISTELSKMQKQASLDIDSVPARAAMDPSILAPPGPAAASVERLDREIEALLPGFINKSTKLQLAIDRTRSEISLRFSDSVRDEILKLRNINWPDSR
nr:hypothetical protein [uncultured Pseudomonas sp.]